jgi:hypothetical protein
MKIYYTCLFVCAFILLIQVGSIGIELQSEFVNDTLGQQQRPPLSIGVDEECHIADATPLLIKSDYKSKGYKLIKLKVKPLIIEENVSPSKSVDLRIEQRGCEDYYGKFKFVFRGKADRKRGIKSNLQKASQIITNLKISRRALLNREVLAQITKVMIKESKKSKPLNQQVTCLDKTDNECISDVSLKYQFPHLEIFYVTRP